MKRNQTPKIDPTMDHPLPVRFEFTHPTAKSVSLAGSFNNWQPEAKTLHPGHAGKWFKETALKPGRYEYCFVVDGQWVCDPNATEQVSNPYGGQNSVITVTGPNPIGKV